MKQLVRVLGVALVALTLSSVPASAGERAPTGAMFRWWWPGAAVDDAELVHEIDAISDAGYKGVEIADVMISVNYAVDPDTYGFGTPRWKHAVNVALSEAARRGLQVDLTLGAQWPAAVPGLDVDGPSSSKELAYGVQVVKGGHPFSGVVPAASAHTYEDRTSVNGVISSQTKTAQDRFVSVSAVRCLDDCSSRPLKVDLSSTIDLSARLINGTLSWTPPDSGNWAVVGYWYHGTGQRNDAPFGTTPYLITDPESRVIDHFGRSGTQAMIDYFNGLLDPKTRALLRRAGGSIFEDSLELTYSQAWTPEFQQRFRELRGYSLAPYLAAIAHDPATGPFGAPSPAFAFTGADAAVAQRVVRDVQQTLNDLYLSQHTDVLKRWANSLGLTYRAQPYGAPIDLAQAASRVDIPESESLACGLCDDWRSLTTGADLAGHNVVSDEMLAGGFGGSYKVTYEQVAQQANGEYAMGANQMVFHGFPYARWPQSADGTVTDSAALWPGFQGFPAFIPEPYGPRQPEWTMASDYAAYYARTQAVLQAGKRRTDVAVYNQALDHLGDTAWSDPGLLAAGYTYGYLTPGSLALPTAFVAGRRLAPFEPAFKALVLNHQATMPLDTARELLRFARAGLPVIVVGAAPSSTPGYTDAAQQDAALRDVIAAMLAQPSVKRVADAATVPAALAAVNVDPDASSSAAAIRTIHRVDGDTDYYYVYNSSAQPVSGTVTLSGDGAPYEIDAWTGETDRVAQYTGRSTLPVTLAPSEAKLFVLAGRRDDLHVVSTSGGEPHADHGKLVLRASEDGTYVTRLSDGRTSRDRVTGVPAPIALPTWNLAVDDWRPGAATDPSSTTSHLSWTFNGISLKPWSAIPQITDSSGIGRYTTTVNVRRGFDGAYLDLGTVNGSYRVRVNGHPIAVDQLSERVDLGRGLRPGVNTIEVVVATTLNNRVRVTRPADFGGQAKQDYGVLGPVTVRPYVDVTLGDRS